VKRNKNAFEGELVIPSLVWICLSISQEAGNPSAGSHGSNFQTMRLLRL